MELLVHNADYSRLLYRILMDYGKISIAGVGTFVLIRKAAEFNDGRTSIQAPRTEVEFSYEEDPTCMITDILAEEGLEPAYGQSLSTAIQTDYQNAKAENKPFKLGEFGVLINKVVVESSQGVFNKYAGLEQADIHPAAKSAKVPAHSDDFTYGLNYKHGTTSSGNSMQYFWPILAALITVFVLLLRLGGNHETKNSGSIPEVTIDTATVVQDTSQVNEQDTMSQTIAETVSSETASSGTVGEATGSDKQENSAEISEPSPAGECILIAGAFKNPGNARKLAKKIRKKGYRTFEQDHNGLRRVGILFDCNDPDPDKFKAGVERKFKQKMWYLKDTI